MYEDKILKDDYVEDIIIKRKDYKETVNKKASFNKSVIDRRENITSYKKINIKKEDTTLTSGSQYSNSGMVSSKDNISQNNKNYKKNTSDKGNKTQVPASIDIIIPQSDQKSNSLSKIQEKIRIAQEIKKLRNGEESQSNVLEGVSKLLSKIFNIGSFALIGATLLVLVPIIAIIVVVIGMGLLISGTSYNAEDKDLNETYKYITELRVDLEEDMLDLADRYDRAYFYKNGSSVSYPEVIFEDKEILAFLAAKYDDYKFRDIKNDLKDIFKDSHSYTKETRTTTRKDSEGKVISRTHKVYIYYTEIPFEEYILDNDLLEDDELEHYNAFKEQSGTYTRQVLGNPFNDIEWELVVSSPYGYRILDTSTGKEFHEGLDLAMPQGTEIKATMSGKVELKHDAYGYGNYITIKNGKNITLYGHMSSFKSGLATGDMVAKGDVIGYVGSTGRSTGPHLHLGYKIDGEWYNPAFYLIE